MSIKSASTEGLNLRSNIVANRDHIYFVANKHLQVYSRHSMQKLRDVDKVINHTMFNSSLFLKENLLVVGNDMDFPCRVGYWIMFT